MSKFFYNRATTRICAKKPLIVIESKILTTHSKKSKQTFLLAGQKHATFYTLVWARTFRCRARYNWRRQTAGNLQFSPGQPPHRYFDDMAVAEDLGWLRTLHCSRHLIYARACVNKDFVHSGSIGLI